jgi:hypothetical protein
MKFSTTIFQQFRQPPYSQSLPCLNGQILTEVFNMAMRNAKVKDIADFFNKLVAAGKGEYWVDASTQDGASYDLWVSDENKDSDYSNGIAVVHDIIKSVTIGE